MNSNIVLGTLMILMMTTFVGVGAQSGGFHQTAMIPAYFWDSSLWAEIQRNPIANGVVIYNPSSGPGTSFSTLYGGHVNNTKALGMKLIGYVDTNFGNRNITEVLTDITRFKSWYNGSGIYLDRTAYTGSYLPYYTTLVNHVRQGVPNGGRGHGGYIVLGMGTPPEDLAYFNISDAITISLKSIASFKATWTVPSWLNNYAPDRLAIIIYNATKSSDLPFIMNFTKVHRVGFVYCTDDNQPNPWDTLGSYYPQYIASLNSTHAIGPAPYLPPTRSMSSSTSLSHELEMTTTFTLRPTQLPSPPPSAPPTTQSSNLTVVDPRGVPIVPSLIPPITGVSNSTRSGFIYPVPRPYLVSDTFGPRTVGGRQDFHLGLDFVDDYGTKVVAVADAAVYNVYPEGSTNYPNGGNVVVLQHSLPSPVIFHNKTTSSLIYTVYMHLAGFNVSQGDTVTQGQQIGLMGQSGSADSVVLHFEFRVGTICSLEYQLKNPSAGCADNGFDPHVHPFIFLPPLGGAAVNNGTLPYSSLALTARELKLVGSRNVSFTINRKSLVLNRIIFRSPYAGWRDLELDFTLRTGFNATVSTVLDNFTLIRPLGPTGQMVVIALNPLAFRATDDNITYIIETSSDVRWLERFELYDVWGNGLAFSVQPTNVSSPGNGSPPATASPGGIPTTSAPQTTSSPVGGTTSVPATSVPVGSGAVNVTNSSQPSTYLTTVLSSAAPTSVASTPFVSTANPTSLPQGPLPTAPSGSSTPTAAPPANGTSLPTVSDSPPVLITGFPNITLPNITHPQLPTTGPAAAAAVTTTSTAATATVMSASAVVGGASGGAALDLQAVVAVGLTECASSQMKSVSDSGKRTVTPLPFTVLKRTGGALGNIVIAAGFLLLHFIGVIVISKIPYFHRIDVTPMVAAMSKARFPTLSFDVFVLLSQGIALESLSVVLQPNGVDVIGLPPAEVPDFIIAGCGLALLIAAMAGPTVWMHKVGQHIPYLPYTTTIASYSPLVRRILLPKHFWQSTDSCRRLRSIISWIDGPRFSTLAALPTVRTILVALAAYIPINCKTRLWLIASVFFVYAVLLALLRPKRSPLTLISTIVLSLLSGFMVLTGLWPTTLGPVAGPCMLVVTGISVVALISNLLLKRKERQWRKEEMDIIEKQQPFSGGADGTSGGLAIPMLTLEEQEGLEAAPSAADHEDQQPPPKPPSHAPSNAKANPLMRSKRTAIV